MSLLSSVQSEANISPLSNQPNNQSTNQSINQLYDEATLSLLYNQPPPLTNAPIDPALSSLQQIDHSMLTCLGHLSRAIQSINQSINQPDELTSSIDGLIESLGSIDASARLTQVTVPLSLIDMIDQGINPESLMSSTLERASTVNDAMRGKMQATEALRTSLEMLAEQLNQAQSTNRSTNQSTNQSTNDESNDAASDPEFKITIDQSINPSVDSSINQTIQQSNDSSLGGLIDASADLQSMDDQLPPPVDDVNQQPTDQSINQSIDQSDLLPPVMMEDEAHVDIV